MWNQVMESQKDFFYEVGGRRKAREIFGLFFNGFFLAHELGHAMQSATQTWESSLYQNEYFANTVAIMYWRKDGRLKNLRKCYRYARLMMRQLPDPVPEGEDQIKYFNDHYQELGADPYKYGYYQFAQFVKIYEDEKLETFDVFVSRFLNGNASQP